MQRHSGVQHQHMGTRQTGMLMSGENLIIQLALDKSQQRPNTNENRAEPVQQTHVRMKLRAGFDLEGNYKDKPTDIDFVNSLFGLWSPSGIFDISTTTIPP